MTPGEVMEIVRRFEQGYAAAFNGRDAHALAALFVEDATIVTEWGDVADGVIVSHGKSHRSDTTTWTADHLTFTRVLVRQGDAWRLAANHVSEPSQRADPRGTHQ